MTEQAKTRIITDGVGSWKFDSPEVVAAFDAHVREQLPWYELATGVVVHLARHFIPEGGEVIDVGCSTGNIGRALAPVLEQRKAELLALDNSPEMGKAYAGPGAFAVADITTFDFTRYQPDLVVAFLTLMFLPPATRGETIQRMKDVVRPGGAIVVFDKREPAGGELGQIVYRLTLAAKYEAGATAEEIIAKELSLAGVQRPMHPDELEDFQEVFRFGDFSGWVWTAPKGFA